MPVIAKLSNADIRRAIAGPDQLLGDGGNLWLQVRGENGASWIFRYSRGGKTRNLGLGPVHTVGVEDARERARQLRLALRDGRDPAEERAQERRTAESRRIAEAAQRKTFRELAEEHIARNAAAWADKAVKAALEAGRKPPKKGSAHQWRSSLEAYAFPFIGALRADEIQTEDVLRVLEPIWATKTETAARVRGRIEAVLDAAMASKRATKRPNPAAWAGNLEHLLPARGRVHRSVPMAALDWREVPAFLPRLRAVRGDSARALEASMLTAARSNEIRGLKWADLHDLDGDSPAWLLKSENMKAGQAHAVPLVRRVVELIAAQPRRPDCPYVFAQQNGSGAPWRALGENAMLATLDELEVDATQHGMRSALRTWVLEATEFKRELVELTLAHATGESDAERSYIRGSAFDQRRELLEAWSRYMEGLAPIDPHVRVPAKRAELKAVA